MGYSQPVPRSRQARTPPRRCDSCGKFVAAGAECARPACMELRERRSVRTTIDDPEHAQDTDGRFWRYLSVVERARLAGGVPKAMCLVALFGLVSLSLILGALLMLVFQAGWRDLILIASFYRRFWRDLYGEQETVRA